MTTIFPVWLNPKSSKKEPHKVLKETTNRTQPKIQKRLLTIPKEKPKNQKKKMKPHVFHSKKFKKTNQKRKNINNPWRNNESGGRNQKGIEEEESEPGWRSPKWVCFWLYFLVVVAVVIWLYLFLPLCLYLSKFRSFFFSYFFSFSFSFGGVCGVSPPRPVRTCSFNWHSCSTGLGSAQLSPLGLSGPLPSPTCYTWALTFPSSVPKTVSHSQPSPPGVYPYLFASAVLILQRFSNALCVLKNKM